ncbi:MAG: ribose-phosphate diphosphokinase [Holosporaceae bacterium]|jgi:ribose-phosphate pyrophosphokinase|nr:ribose-phosphate diphosphokinase [Holosporaceae bacterium]
MDIVYTRNSKELAKAIAKDLNITAVPAGVRVFHNKELYVSLEKSFGHVMVVGSTVTSDDWIELFLLLDAMKNASSIILCLPYLGYSRQDRQNRNESFGAGLFPKLLESAGNISGCIVLDNHCEPPMHTPVYHISAQKIFEADIITKYGAEQIIVVSPDLGGAYRADAYARSIGCNFAICNKARSIFGDLKKVDYFGKVDNRICIVIDDMIDSGATLCHAADAMHRAGSKFVIAYVSHGILSDGAVEKLEKSDISEIIISDSIEISRQLPEKFRKLSIASLIAEEVRYIM